MEVTPVRVGRIAVLLPPLIARQASLRELAKPAILRPNRGVSPIVLWAILGAILWVMPCGVAASCETGLAGAEPE